MQQRNQSLEVNKSDEDSFWYDQNPQQHKLFEQNRNQQQFHQFNLNNQGNNFQNEQNQTQPMYIQAPQVLQNQNLNEFSFIPQQNNNIQQYDESNIDGEFHREQMNQQKDHTNIQKQLDFQEQQYPRQNSRKNLQEDNQNQQRMNNQIQYQNSNKNFINQNNNNPIFEYNYDPNKFNQFNNRNQNDENKIKQQQQQQQQYYPNQRQSIQGNQNILDNEQFIQQNDFQIKREYSFQEFNKSIQRFDENEIHRSQSLRSNNPFSSQQYENYNFPQQNQNNSNPFWHQSPTKQNIQQQQMFQQQQEQIQFQQQFVFKNQNQRIIDDQQSKNNEFSEIYHNSTHNNSQLLNQQIKQIVIDISKSSTTNQQFQTIGQLLNYIIGKFDFEIKLKNIDQSQNEYIKVITQQLKLQNIMFQQEIQNYEKLLIQQKIYQIKSQENNISQEQRMVFLYFYNIFSSLEQFAFQNFKVLINATKFQFKLNGLQNSSEKQADQYFQNFKNELDQTYILYVECKSITEAVWKLNLLTQMKQKLLKTLNVQKLSLLTNTQIPLNDITAQLLPWAKQIQDQTPCIFCIVQSSIEIQLMNLQINFKNFVFNNLKQVDDNFQISIYQVLDQQEIDKKINHFKEQNKLEIIITPPNFDIQKGTYIISVQYTFWIEEYQSQQMVDQKKSYVKNEIQNIYNPDVELKLCTQEEIKIWVNVVAEQFENNSNNQECITKHQNQDLAIIQINKFQQNALKKRDQILSQLKLYDFMEKEYTCEEEILKIISDAQLQKLFKVILEQSLSIIGKSKIKLIKIEKGKTVKFEIYYYKSRDINLIDIDELIQDHFLFKLIMFELKIDLQLILDYQKITENQFAEQNQIIIHQKQDKKNLLIGLFDQILYIEQLIDEINENSQNNYQTEIVHCSNKLIFKKLIQNKEIVDLNQGQIKIEFKNNDEKIMITGDKCKIQEVKQKIQQIIQKYSNNLVNNNFNFCHKKVKYVRKHLQILVDQYQKEEEVIIQYVNEEHIQNINQQLQKSIATQLNFEGKSLYIIYADISSIECDAVVNSCHEKMVFGDSTNLSGVAQSIFAFGGTSYQQFCQDYININKKLEVGKAITYLMPKEKHIKYIINVTTPIYSNGQQVDSDLLEIQQNINSIFQEAGKYQIKSLVLPIFGGGACGYSFSQASRVVLRTIINNLFSNKYNLQKIYIAEIMDSKIFELQEQLQFMLQPQKEIRKVKYQWQWQNSKGFFNYDDEDVNRQIDELYEVYQNTQQEQEYQLEFPVTKQPGTHYVDLENQKCFDLALNKEIPISFKIINNSKKYFLNNEQVDDQINEYFLLQEMNKNITFQIFYKRYLILMNDQGEFQMNLDTEYIRKIQKSNFIQKEQKDEIKLVLINKQYDLNNYPYQKIVFKKNSEFVMKIQSFDGYLNQKIIQDLSKELQKVIKIFKINVPELQNEDLQNFELQLQQYSISIQGQFRPGNQLDLEIFEKKQPIIQQYLDRIKLSAKVYPLEWVSQNTNFIKYQIQSGTSEFIKIQQLFNKTDQGQIHEIFRIQNKALWDNYISEKNKLISIYQQQGLKLSDIEQSRYLWHGVRGQHPQIIYSGLKEAFDQTYSNVGSWGAGIYFAENASYSRGYSFTITNQEDPQNQGRKVFLCCLVTTGKVQNSKPDQKLKRPAEGYDCIQGVTGGSNVFILYSMDIRRAYPAYEVIFS